jgi:spore coat protein U-like protein
VNRTICLLAGLLIATPSAMAVITCGFLSTTSVAFGAYDALAAAPNDTMTSIVVRCESSVPGNPQVDLTLAIGPGRNAGAANSRRMQQVGGSDYLAYGLFRDQGRSAIWGFTPGVDAMTQAAKVQNNRLVDVTFNVYGRIPARQDVSVGDYSDFVQVTITP